MALRVFGQQAVKGLKHMHKQSLMSSKDVSLMYQSTAAASTKSLDISGILPPIPTPFNEDGSFAFDKLKFNMDKWNKIPFKGYVVLGSNGECGLLNWDERVQLLEETKKLADPSKLVVGGSGCDSTRDTVLMTKRMANAGADAVLVVNPSFYKASMTYQALMAHYTKVADESPVPVILYNVPSNTGMDIPPEVIISLSQHPNIIGLKDSGGDITRITTLCFQTASSGFQILAGSAGFLLAAYNVGCVGGVCGLANIIGEDLCRLMQLAKTSDLKTAMDLQLRLVGPNTCVTRKYGVPGLKAALEWFGYYGGPTRLPLVPLTADETEFMRKAFQKSGYLD
ncbi:4-hydroxy-2-oxoglutarate aldolase, mitochondrial [Aplysia californica]|uniref:4-hydroxy-2-oxoglutarate aldolase, mitochondrial n=1 Tax=Aplysia californica TaxID=6500 RepID=A0ABM1AFZ3_APLCA|nr:4-hydroxy-2-oxoglutarate aldolase, mitochondrial [Aplysia californica]XP_005091883.1 4-hydroxy-2-oxoglutarate aldolase, mitochondrial [Aplysia californica]XP_005091884.1 4-hydroxy-2-oxoglutarate aldolase, mitochondrial [Aplysia californica]XP_012946900.1 4-hydroxy-2-oxoglutarate aldolase, mitochondrial [Aplysia californica]XP_035829817.1 4-hydroxy-2-oxoglutarate aldolase, mitochondrial [Aplysia californica]